MGASEKKPTTYNMVIEAMKGIKYSMGGASRPALYKKLGDLYPGLSMALARKAINKQMEDGHLAHGSTKARFKLTPKGREYAKKYMDKKEGKVPKSPKKKGGKKAAKR